MGNMIVQGTKPGGDESSVKSGFSLTAHRALEWVWTVGLPHLTPEL